MRDIRVGVAQFEARDRDKSFNLERIDHLTARAVAAGAEVVSFHECCIPGYTFLMELSRAALAALAEPVPDGASIRELQRIARRHDVVVAAGLIEVENDRFFNTYVVMAPEGLVARFRKIHPFVSPHFSPGDEHIVFEMLGCRWGILICYDNNLPENVRVTALEGAEIIFMPHVTCGLDSPMPGRGRIPRQLWDAREKDPAPLRLEFQGPKARGWLMRWLPCRAYENGIYALFTNMVGVDHDTVKSGASMIIDPFGEIVVECTALGDEVIVGWLTADRPAQASGRRYQRARRPDLYGKLVEPPPPDQPSVTLPGWKLTLPESDEPT